VFVPPGVPTQRRLSGHGTAPGVTGDFTHGEHSSTGLREILQETHGFLPSNIGLSGLNFPIIQFYGFNMVLIWFNMV